MLELLNNTKLRKIGEIVKKILKEILEELKSINKKLQAIESSKEQDTSLQIDTKRISRSVVESIRGKPLPY